MTYTNYYDKYTLFIKNSYSIKFLTAQFIDLYLNMYYTNKSNKLQY